MTGSWLVNSLLPLPRPEYAKQTEALLTDLLWRSRGSSLGGDTGTGEYFEDLARARLEPENPRPAQTCCEEDTRWFAEGPGNLPYCA